MKKVIKVIIGLVTFFVIVYGIIFAINVNCNKKLRSYIESFEPVEYGEDRIVPKKVSEHYSLTSDRDIKILHITDMHIGGGFWSYKDDIKSIYEVITILQNEKPDLVILGGDNTYCVPGFGYNGGFTFNNKMVATTVISIFEHERVYFSTVFGNHDTESLDYASRQEIGDLYMDPSFEYCIFEQEYTDTDSKTIPSVSNQIIELRNANDEITKLLVLIDTNAYVDTKFISSVLWKYDTVHDAQIMWAADEIKKISSEQGYTAGEYIKSIVIGHIPVGEYRSAHDELFDTLYDSEGAIAGYSARETSEDTYLIEGVWGENDICIGGYKDTDIKPNDKDILFEVLGQELGSMELMLCGHDHLNNAAVSYKGIVLAYGYSIDNEAYGKTIKYYGRQRGATLITVAQDGSFERKLKNAYDDYGVDKNKFVQVTTDEDMKPSQVRPY